MALRCHPSALLVGGGDDLERFCGDRGAVVRALVHISGAAGILALDWPAGDGRLDAHGLPQAAPARRDLLGSLRRFADAGWSVLFGSVARDASLDPVWLDRNPAFGTRE